MAMDPIPAIQALKDDARSGASELLPRAVAMLRAVLQQAPASIDVAARAVGEAQPSMAPFWNAALAAVRNGREPGALDRFEERHQRAGAAVARVAARELRPADGSGLRAVTCSFSGTVLQVLGEIARGAAGNRRVGDAGRAAGLAVCCAEGRPALEGRRMAKALAGEGIDVTFFSDAAIASALERAEGRPETVVLIGADAVSPDWLVNKVGSGMLAAAAAHAGVPVYVAASRDKLVDRRVARLLRIVEHDAGELWEDPPAGVAVRNAYFERMPTGLVAGFVTDAGVLSADMLEEACRAASAAATDEDIARLAPGSR
jgi:translation initiation factor 2B subunit (eIF-2B alpha/beta/delta family)